MGSISIPGDSEDTSRVVRETLPAFPDAPEVPAAPLLARRTNVRDLEIRPLAGPPIPIPRTEDEDFLRRYDAFRLQQVASIPEFIVYEWLVNVKKQQDGVDFTFQAPFLGGRTEFGGFVLDFFFPALRVGWRIQGERYHLLLTQDRARDAIARQILEGRGIQIIDLFETDLLTRSEFVLQLAWDGQEVQGVGAAGF